MRIIDAHMHIVQAEFDNGRNMLEALDIYQRDNGIDAVDIMSCTNNNHLWDGYELDQNLIAGIAKLENPGVYAHGSMVIPREKEACTGRFRFDAQIEELWAMGFDGIKCCEYKPDSYVLYDMDRRDEEYERYFETCERLGIPMCWHVADPEGFWDADKVSPWLLEVGWFYGDGLHPAKERLYEKAFAVLDRHPNLKVMLAHAFFMSETPERMKKVFDRYPNVCIDLAPGWEMFDGFRKHDREWNEIFRKYSNRIMFATDATLSGTPDTTNSLARHVLRFLRTPDTFQAVGNHTAKGIALEEAPLADLCYRNCVNMLGERPRPLDRKRFADYVRDMLPLLPDTRNRAWIENYYQRRLK